MIECISHVGGARLADERTKIALIIEDSDSAHGILSWGDDLYINPVNN